MESTNGFTIRVPLLYALFGGLWILFSDRLLMGLIKDIQTLTMMQTYKGWGFVAVSTVLLYCLLRAEWLKRKHIEEQVVQQNKLLTAVLERITEGFIALDKDWRYTYVNQQAAIMLNRQRPEDLIGKHIWTEYPEGIGQPFHLAYERAMQTLQPVYLEDYYAPWDRWFENRVYPSPDGLTIFFSDITERKRMEEALREKSEELEHYFTSSLDLVCIADTQGYFRRLNPEWERTLGYSLAELEGKRFLDFVHPDDLQSTLSVIAQLSEQREVLNFVNRYRHKDGSYRWIEWRSYTAGDLIYAAARDITERQRAEEEIRRRADELAALNALGAAVSRTLDLAEVVALAVEGVVKAARPDLAFLFLREGERLLLRGVAPADGRGLFNGVPEHRVGECICGLAAREGRPLYSRDIFADLRCTWEECRRAGLRSLAALPLCSGTEVLGVVGIAARAACDFEAQAAFLETIATQVAAGIRNALLHDQVQRHAAELERRVAERTAELEIARDKAQEADHLKSAFLATMSHELRTPLNSIIGFTGMLLEGWAGPLNEEQDKQLKMVYNSAKHLLALINDILDLSKIEAGQLELHPSSFSLPDLVAEVVRTMHQQTAAKGLELRVQFDPRVGMITADRRRLEQVLLNLVGNAIKFTEAGQVTVKTLSKIENQKSKFEIQVVDTGIGIRAEDMDQLFQEFRQLEPPRTRRYEGTGLGLAICKKLVTMMGGEIWAESEGPGKGSTFTVKLPV